jgi:phosphatidate cytidylyltransferase
LTTSHLIDIVSGFAGKGANTHKPLSRLSPNKTVRGFGVGAVIGAPVGLVLAVPLQALNGTLIANFLGPFPIWLEGICVGMGLWATTVLGDLVGSKVKRILQVKDYGSSLGPHGGFMDRLDAFVPAVVAGCLLVS